MMWFGPARVMIDGQTLTGVQRVMVSQKADELIVEYGDAGPEAQYVDVPRRRWTIEIDRSVAEDQPSPVWVGDLIEIEVCATPRADDGPCLRGAGRVVVTAVQYSTDAKAGVGQRLTGVAVSDDGLSPGIVVSQAVVDGGA